MKNLKFKTILLICTGCLGIIISVIIGSFFFLDRLVIGKEIQKTVVLDSAKTDGFEIVLVKYMGNLPIEAKTVKLRDVDSLDSTWSKRIAISQIKLLSKLVEKQDHCADNNSTYPFVSLELGHNNEVDLSFHYSKSTYHYCYKQIDETCIPIWSSLKSFGINKKTIYLPNY